MTASQQNISLYDVSQSLRHLRESVPKLKQAIAQACSHTVLIDEQVSEREAELLRAILITLGYPVPPFVDSFF